MSAIARFYNLFRGLAPIAKQDKSNDILPYGKTNDFPLRLTEAVYDSPVATATLGKLKKYIAGDGFAVDEIANLKINSEGQSMDTLLKQIVEDYTLLRGFALHITYNQLFKILEIKHVPFETCRLQIPDDKGNVAKIGVNPFYGLPDFKKNQTKFYDVFDPSKVAEQYAAEKDMYKGQIFWYAETKINNRFYPVPDYYSAMQDIVADAKTGTYRERLVDNNFYQSVLIQMIGDPDEKIQLDEKGERFTTIGEQFDEDLRSMTGGEAAGSALVTWSRDADSMPKVVPFPNNYNDKISEAFIKQVQQNICMAVGVHPVLIGIDQSSSLGNNNILINAIKMLQQNVNEPQRDIERALQYVMKYWNVPFDVSAIVIRPLSLVVDLPDYVLNSLTTEEKRLWIQENYDVELVNITDELKDRLNVINTLSPIVANKVIEKLTNAEIRGLVGLPPIEDVIGNQMNDLTNMSFNTPMNVSKSEIDARYKEYHSLVNMTYKELQLWSESECCKALGYSKQPIQRNLHLLNTNKGEWGSKEYRIAGQIISAINRLLEYETDTVITNGETECGNKRDLALKNLGYRI